MTVNEGIRVHEVKVCLLCGNEGELLYQDLRDRRFGAPGIWSLVYCPEDELVWLNPRSIDSDIKKLYTEYYTHQPKDSSKKRLASLREAIKARILQKSFGYSVNALYGPLARIFSWIGPLKEIVGGSVMWLKASDRKRLLDVGCGNGQFLVQMQQLGWEVAGVEPDPEAVCLAKKHLGSGIFQGTLEKAKFPDDSFDAITMNHVIEHVPNPIELLVECRRDLKPGGKLVVVTPNIRSLVRCLFGKYWSGWEVPLHFFLFSPKALKKCSEQTGLHIQELRTVSKAVRYIWYASRLLRKDRINPGGNPGQISPQFTFEGIMFWVIEYMLCQLYPWGEEIVLIADKGSET